MDDGADSGAARYAGLWRATEPGLAVGAGVERLRRLAYVERRLMLLLAARVVTAPERDVKALLARLQYEDSQHADSLYRRVLEMRTNKSKLEGAPDAALAALFDEAEHLRGTYVFLAVVAGVVKPALAAAYRAYIAATNGLADYPSVRLAGQTLADEEEHQRLLELALRTQEARATAEERAEAAAEGDALRAWLAAAGGIDGCAARAEAPERRHAQRYAIPHTVVRDDSLRRVWDYVAPPMAQVDDHLAYMMGLRLSEINVAEGLAIVLCETEEMPWSFYADIARHLWDEMRHSLFGEAAVEATYGDRRALPMRDYEGVYAMEAPPLEQYAVLGLEVEGKNMKYPPGKRQEWEFARDTAAHPLMTTLQDFDWADEVLHVNIARRRLDEWFAGGLKAIGEFSRAGREHRAEVKRRQPPTALDAGHTRDA